MKHRPGGNPLELDVLSMLAKRFKTPLAKQMVNITDGPTYFAVRSGLLPSAYTSAETFSCDYLLANLLKKWNGWDGFDPKRAAIDTWIGAEQQCAATNAQLAHRIRSSRWRAVTIESQRLISAVIGVCPDMRRIAKLCRFGGGATSDVSRREANVANKLTGISTTEACKQFAYLLCDDGVDREPADYDEWRANELFDFNVVRGNRGVLVPKSAKTDRAIACEPTLNSFVQQGIGRFFKRKLLSVAGVTLTDQQVNQDLAKLAQKAGLATLDLSSASDTLAISVVKLLLPPLWFDFLDAVRSPYTSWTSEDGSSKTFLLEKFAAMGNAFTFELESLIFWAVSLAVQRCEQLSDKSNGAFCNVFGDDIIVPQCHYQRVVDALETFGFTVNLEKSFGSGSFFESCGVHYFDGIDVTPVHDNGGQADGDRTSRRSEMIRLHNRLYRWGLANDMAKVKDALHLIQSRYARDFPRGPHPEVPEGYNDVGFYRPISAFDPDRNGDFRCWTLSTLPVSRTEFYSCDALHYFYHLRTGLNPDSSPAGWQVRKPETRTRIVRTRVWRSSVTAAGERRR